MTFSNLFFPADDPVGRGETDMLKAEADMPLEQLLAKYKSNPNIEEEKNQTRQLYIQSPVIKPKENKEIDYSTVAHGNESQSSPGLTNGTTTEEGKIDATTSSTTVKEESIENKTLNTEKDQEAPSSGLTTQVAAGDSGSSLSRIVSTSSSDAESSHSSGTSRISVATKPGPIYDVSFIFLSEAIDLIISNCFPYFCAVSKSLLIMNYDNYM